ncbi:MAG: hypothetical protein U0531_06545 [Dehalococcoidia bacterium]
MTAGMTAADLFRILWVADPRLSPDGRRVAFTVTRLDAEADDYRSTIWLAFVDGAAARPLTSGPGKDSAPRWSPDGTQLAFLSDRAGGRPQVYLIDAGGGEARRLTDIPAGCRRRCGRRTAAASSPVVRDDPAAAPADGANPTTPPARVITALKYRANGEGFTYDRRRHLYVIDADTGAARQVTEGDWDDIQPCWSPDGRRIAFVSARHDSRDLDRAVDIFIVDADGGDPTRITPRGGAAGLPAWSPDGAWLAYLGHADAEDEPRCSRLWLVPAAGGEPRCLTAAYDRHLEISETAAPVWSADGGAITVGVLDRGAAGVVRVRVTDGAVTPIGPAHAPSPATT